MRNKCKYLLWVALTWLMGICTVMAQEGKVVSGTVTDSTGSPVAAATVAEKGMKNSTSTNDRGQFSLRVTSANPILVISYIGFATQEVGVGNRSSVNISLEGASSQLTDVVVTALGISRKEKALGYATSTIKAEDITRVASPNFASALYGKAPGVRIGATPGGATSAVNIQIRGVNSVTGRNQPLIVLDGVPIRDGEVTNNNYWDDSRLRGNGLLDINPEDVDNISILKGASAAALYGSEAVNGVVLITTKSGKGRKGFNVDVNANYNVSEVAYLPRYQNVRGAGAPLNVNNAGQDDAGFIYYDTNGDGTTETRGILPFSINFGPKFDGQPIMSWDGKMRPYSAQKDNYAGFFQTAHSSSINVAMSQATENSNVRFSLTRQDNEGTSIGSKNTKNIANLNTTVRLGKKWTSDLMVNYVNQHTKNRPYSIDRMINNFTGMIGRFDNASWYLDKYKTSLGYRYVTGKGTQSLTPEENIYYNGFKNDIGDYVWRIKEHNEDEYSNRVIASMTHNWQILKNLRLRGRLATDFTSMKIESRQSTEIPLAYGNSGYFGQAQQNNTILYGDLLLTYTKKLTSDLELNVMGGYTATEDEGNYVLRSTTDGLSTENMFDVKASVGTAGGNQRRYKEVKDAFIGTVNADYKGLLFLEGTLRSDRTSTMHPDRNSYLYPSVNSSFIFSDAFQMPTWLNFGKLRASWGIVGNYPERYKANVAYNQESLGAQYLGGAPVAYTYTSIQYGNDFIEPEKKNEFEIGLELKMLNKKLSLDMSYYNAQIQDQILPLTIPGSSGAREILTNIGTLRNKGIEIGLQATPVRTKNFQWNFGLNYAKNVNKVEKLTTGSNEILHADYDGNAAQLKSVVGQPMGDFYAHPVATNGKGEMIVNPDGLYKLDANNMVKVGNAMPKAVGGFSNTLTYKGFVLDALIDYRFGGYVMPTGINWMISRGLLEESLNYMDKEHGGLSYYVDANNKGIQTNAAQGPNGEKVYNDGMLIKGVTEDGQQNANVISQAYYYWNTYNWGGPQYSSSRYELYIVKNSYIKMRELSLGYNLPANISKKIGAKNLQFSVFGRNLFYIYRTIKDIDAEQTVAGSRWFQSLNNAGTNPSTRTYGMMLRANF